MKINLLQGVPIRVIISISEKNNYVAKIMKETKSTLSHITKIIYKLEESKIITKTKRGRKTIIRLTPKGLEIKKHLIAIQNII